MGGGGSAPKPPKPKPLPPPPPVVAPVTNEDENVRDAATNERRRIYNQKGRKSTQLLDSSGSGSANKDLLG